MLGQLQIFKVFCLAILFCIVSIPLGLNAQGQNKQAKGSNGVKTDIATKWPLLFARINLLTMSEQKDEFELEAGQVELVERHKRELLALYHLWIKNQTQTPDAKAIEKFERRAKAVISASEQLVNDSLNQKQKTKLRHLVNRKLCFYDGFDAGLLNGKVQKSVDLSKEQKNEIEKTVSLAKERSSRLKDSVEKTVNDLKEEAIEKILKVLSEEQKADLGNQVGDLFWKRKAEKNSNGKR